MHTPFTKTMPVMALLISALGSAASVAQAQAPASPAAVTAPQAAVAPPPR